MSPRKARRLPAEIPRRPRGGAGRADTAGSRVAGGQGSGGRVTGGRGGGGQFAGGRGGIPGRAGEPSAMGPPQTQTWPDGEWVVRHVPGAAATKTYRCPGCDQEILPGVPHVVVWPAESPGPAERRHWHNSCWQRRPRRPGPGPRTRR